MRQCRGLPSDQTLDVARAFNRFAPCPALRDSTWSLHGCPRYHARRNAIGHARLAHDCLGYVLPVTTAVNSERSA